MYYPVRSGQFKRDYKLCIKRNYDISLIDKAIEILVTTGTLPSRYLPHLLRGSKNELWEAHIKPDWLITWYIENDDSLPEFDGSLNLVRTGTHSDLF